MGAHLNTRSQATSAARWQVRRVYRHNAGGALYAPVDNNGNEYGVTPSYDDKAVQRFVDSINAMEFSRVAGRHILSEGYLTTYRDGTYVMCPWDAAP